MLYAGNRTSTTWVLVFTLNVYDWMVAVDVFMEVSGRFPAVRDNNAGYFTPNQSGLCAQTWLDHKQSVEPKETSSCYIKIVKCPTYLCLQDLLCQHVFSLLGWIMIDWAWLFYDFIVFVAIQIKCDLLKSFSKKCLNEQKHWLYLRSHKDDECFILSLVIAAVLLSCLCEGKL